MKKKWLASAFALALVLFVLAPMASATVIGVLRLNGGTGQVIVNATSIDFTLPVGPPDGQFVVTDNTLTYNAGTVLPAGTAGRVRDLMAPTVFPVMNFLTFTGIPSLAFDLTSVGPGPANTNCATLVLFQSCAAVAGSPFALQLVPTGTSVTLPINGTARDATSVVSNFMGAFTTQIAGQTPAQIQTTIAGGGSVTSSQSAELVLQPIPEPGTLSMLGIGGALIAFSIRRRIRG